MEAVKQFDQLIQEYVGPKKKIVSSNITNLTLPGENYLSDMLKLQVVLKDEDTENIENLNVIAKCAKDDPNMGNTSFLVKNEMQFYKYIAPAFYDFQEKHGVTKSTFFPKFLGGRLNLSGKKDADIDGVLLLEDLSEKGYVNVDRHIGFDLDQAKYVLKDLACFHGTFLALRLLKPDIFKNVIEANIFNGPPPPPPKHDKKKSPPSGMPKPVSLILEHLKSNKKYDDVVPKIEKSFKDFHEKIKSNPELMFKTQTNSPFNTLVHRDMWINNTMQILVDGVVNSNKFVDFQMCGIESPAGDLIFLIISSIQQKIVAENFEDLIKYYYESFKNVLEQYNCYDEQYSYEKFLDDLKNCARHGLMQSMMMIPNVIFRKKGEVFDMSNEHNMVLEDIPKIAVEKLEFLIIELANRGWI